MGDEAFLVRAGILQGFGDACREFEVDPDSLLARVGLPRDVLHDPDLYIHRDRCIALLAAGARQTGCPTFGLRLAARQDQSVIGALAHLISRGATVREALDLARQYLTYHLRGADVTYRLLDAEWCVVEAEMGFEPREENRQSADLTVVHIEGILRKLGGPDLRVREFRMIHPAPDDPAPYETWLSAPIQWEQSALGVVIPAAVLAEPPATVPDIKEFLVQYVEGLAAPLDPDNLASQTRAVVRSLIGSSDVTIEVVSASIGMHVRELQRDLRELGFSFRELRDEGYREYACARLRLPETNVGDLALLLGYSDGSAFSRAFKRWTGKSPTAWRREVLGAR